MQLDDSVSSVVVRKSFLTLENDFNKKHNNKYTYDNFIFKNKTTKGLITCPLHKDFEQTPQAHLKGQGCKKCANTNQSIDFLTYETRARKKHNNKYTYDKESYIDTKNNVDVYCKEHDNKYSINAGNHLYKGNKCIYCSKVRETKAFIKKAEKIFDSLYDYSESVYISNKDKLDIICSKHGKFEQKAGTHLEGHGCPECGKELRTSFLYKKNIDKPCIIYFINIYNSEYNFNKIGITSLDETKNRFLSEKKKWDIDVLDEIKLENGYIGLAFEKYLHNKYKSVNANIKKKLFAAGGESELFNNELIIKLKGEYNEFKKDKNK